MTLLTPYANLLFVFALLSGKYGDQTAQTAASSCKSCENGYYCTGVSGTASVACEAGK